MLSITHIAQKISAGAVGVIPTDTVYGIVCSASNPEAVSRLYGLKHRHQKPGTVIAANIDQLVDLGIPRRYLKPVADYWPNPISIVVPVGLAHAELHLGKMSLALRVPDDAQLQELLKLTGPLLTSSANQPGESVAVTTEQARNYFGDTVDFYLDGGDLSGKAPSTIIRVVDDAIEVLRSGAVEINEAGELTK